MSLAELVVDPGALENVGVLTVDVELEETIMGEQASASRSWFSACVTGDAGGMAIDGISMCASVYCGGVWGPGDERGGAGEAKGSNTASALSSAPKAASRSSIVIPLFRSPGVLYGIGVSALDFLRTWATQPGYLSSVWVDVCRPVILACFSLSS